MRYTTPLWIIAVLLSTGCYGTSKQFQVAAPAGVANVVADMKEYTAAKDWDSNHNGVVDPTERADQAKEVSLTDALSDSIKTQDEITVEGVDTAWQPVQPIWRKYIEDDPSLDTPEDKKIRNDTGDLLNKIIQAERERQAAIGRSPLGIFSFGN